MTFYTRHGAQRDQSQSIKGQVFHSDHDVFYVKCVEGFLYCVCVCAANNRIVPADLQ